MVDFWGFGCEGSGTTWLAQMLDQCPGVQCLHETRIPLVLQTIEHSLIGMLADADLHRNNPANPEAPIRQSSELPRYLDRVLRCWADAAYGELRRRDIRWLGDKHPYYRRIVPFLNALYPSARRVGIWRSAQATVASNRRRFGTPVTDGLADWKQYARFLLEAVSPALVLRYEAVERQGPQYLRPFICYLTGEDVPAKWEPLLPRGSGVPADQVLSAEEWTLIQADPEVRVLTELLDTGA